uniref:Uncharacterized protein n=1 Tax=Arundo donax TaxID=35708 RepID=A0A0A8Z4N5_ARUDO
MIKGASYICPLHKLLLGEPTFLP